MPMASRGRQSCKAGEKVISPIGAVEMQQFSLLMLLSGGKAQPSCRGWVKPVHLPTALGRNRPKCWLSCAIQHSSTPASAGPRWDGTDHGVGAGTSSICSRWRLQRDAAVRTLSTRFAPMRKAVRLVFIRMLFNIINFVTLHTTSNNDKYCNGNVKKKILYTFHVCFFFFSKKRTFIK